MHVAAKSPRFLFVFIDLSLGWLSSYDGDILLHGSWYAGKTVYSP